jgi:hypothetical protein
LQWAYLAIFKPTEPVVDAHSSSSQTHGFFGSREILDEYDNEPHIVLVKEVTCDCGHVTSIDYIVTPISTEYKPSQWLAAVPTHESTITKKGVEYAN